MAKKKMTTPKLKPPVVVKTKSTVPQELMEGIRDAAKLNNKVSPNKITTTTKKTAPTTKKQPLIIDTPKEDLVVIPKTGGRKGTRVEKAREEMADNIKKPTYTVKTKSQKEKPIKELNAVEKTKDMIKLSPYEKSMPVSDELLHTPISGSEKLTPLEMSEAGIARGKQLLNILK